MPAVSHTVALAMSIDFGRAPRGDPRMPHANEGLCSYLMVSSQILTWIIYARGRLGPTSISPRRWDMYVAQPPAALHAQCSQSMQGLLECAAAAATPLGAAAECAACRPGGARL